MGVSIFKIDTSTYEIRVGKNHEKHGDDYETGFVAKEVYSNTIEVRLVSNKISKKDFRSIQKEFEKLGYVNVIWDRRENGELKRSSGIASVESETKAK